MGSLVVWERSLLHPSTTVVGIVSPSKELGSRRGPGNVARIGKGASGCRIRRAVRYSAEVADTERKRKGDSRRGSLSSTAYDSDKGRPMQLPRKPREMSRKEKLDTFGRLRTPRAARELAICTLYSAMCRDVDSVKIFDERLNQRVGRDFDREILEFYDHNPADIGDNETEEDEEKAAALIQQQEEEADAEGTVLLAPLPLVYSRFTLSLARNLVRSTSERWIPQQKTLKAFFPRRWRNEPEISWIPLCIMQIALTEVETTDTSSKVIINEAIDLTRRFCDGAAPRIVHGILARYMETRQSSRSGSSSSGGSTGDSEQLS